MLCVPDLPPEPATEPESLPDEAVVVRGGVMTTVQTLRSTVERCFRDEGMYDISVWASAELDADSIARSVRERDPSCEHLPHKRMQTASVGDIRNVGADVLLTEPPEGHHSIRFDACPTDDQLEALIQAFDPPQDNPAARRT